MDDFKAFCERAHELGLEIALDFALQCSPDHPWVKAHPNWFRTKPDGTIAFAENPPKKYQDIYPIDFNADMEGIEKEVERIMDLWVKAGVTIFRVDNPHTKPVRFWQDVIAAVTKKHPEVLFLAEAFTRPGMMRALSYVASRSRTATSRGVTPRKSSKSTSKRPTAMAASTSTTRSGPPLRIFSPPTCATTALPAMRCVRCSPLWAARAGVFTTATS